MPKMALIEEEALEALCNRPLGEQELPGFSMSSSVYLVDTSERKLIFPNLRFTFNGGNSSTKES